MAKADLGRYREAAEIVRLRRAAAVGRLMLGELDEPLESIRQEDYVAKPRRELKQELTVVRSSLRGELHKFCRRNFIGVTPEDLGKLYADIHAHNGQYRLSLREFVEKVGKLRATVFEDVPIHATVSLSPWGLQTEYPEMHLARDLAISYNDAFDAEKERVSYGKVPWRRAKKDEFKSPLAATLNRGKYSMRMCLLSCFNLTEAFINGIAWEFVQTTDISALSKKQQDLLTKGQANLLDKLMKVPGIVTGKQHQPLAQDRDPLATFRDVVKPFRDSTVHASPFSAPERFGGYDKLARVYELEMATVTTAVDLTLGIIKTIHEYLDRESRLPAWMPNRCENGRFVLG